MTKRLLRAALAFGLLSSTASFAQSTPDAGSYLAARQASLGNDFAAGSQYFGKALLSDPLNASLLENALTAHMALGELEPAMNLAQISVDLGSSSQIGHLLLSAEAVKTGDWAYTFESLEADRTIGPLVDGLSQAWAHLARDETQKAWDIFDEVIATPGLVGYGLYHKALALASTGDLAGADAIFGATDGGLRHNRRSAMAHTQILSALGRNDDAIALLDAVFGDALDPRLQAMRNQLSNGETLTYTTVTSPVEGMSELFFVIAEALRGDAPDNFVLLYARAAEYLRPSDTETLLLVAGILDDLDQHALATTTYAKVATDDPAYTVAELGRAKALKNSGNADGAIEVLRALIRDHPDLAPIYVDLGDQLRQSEQMAEANAAYTRALDLYAPDHPSRWFVHYTRAITAHALDDWTPAEADFRAALALNPDQPQILNYLGYSLVERGEKIEEALDMIKTAVAAQPQNGAIVDSLGWVLFEMGDYAEAVIHLENAAALEAVDPVVNDHLGDAYWAVGREVEAQFQWNRALSFDPKPEDATRIRRKLEVGLDVVLIEEGSDPVRVADGRN